MDILGHQQFSLWRVWEVTEMGARDGRFFLEKDLGWAKAWISIDSQKSSLVIFWSNLPQNIDVQLLSWFRISEAEAVWATCQDHSGFVKFLLQLFWPWNLETCNKRSKRQWGAVTALLLCCNIGKPNVITWWPSLFNWQFCFYFASTEGTTLLILVSGT